MKQIARVCLAAFFPAMLMFCGGGGTDIIGRATPAPDITGKVVTPDALPIAGVEVRLSCDDSTVNDKFRVTDSSGSYTFFKIEPGNYNLLYCKEFYINRSASLMVVDSIEENTIFLPAIELAKIPVPANLKAAYDSMTGIVLLTWDSSNLKIQRYIVRIIDTLVHKDTGDADTRGSKTTLFVDTLFPQGTGEKLNVKFRKYQVKILVEHGIEGQWCEPCAITANRPMVPPTPAFSLAHTYRTQRITVFYDMPPLWWVDSIFIFRSFTDNAGWLRVATLSLNTTSPREWNDAVTEIPSWATDTVLPLFYAVQAKSRYGNTSAFSQEKAVNFFNFCRGYALNKPEKPDGPQLVPSGRYVFSCPANTSPVEGDILEYRLGISGSALDEAVYTSWYGIPCIEALLQKPGKYFIRYQARSGRLSCLMSPLSDSLEVTVSRTYTLSPAPVKPCGLVNATCGSPATYFSEYDDICDYQHNIAIQYAYSFQGESDGDSTDWLVAPHDSAAFTWSNPGKVTVRAHTRCTVDRLAVSPWSEPLTVTVNKEE